MISTNVNQPDRANDELLLDETLTLAGFNPKEDDFDLLKAELRPLLEERIILKIYQALPTEADRAEFDALMTSDTEVGGDNVDTFFRSKIQHFDDFMGDIYAEFQKEYLDAMK
ncbi:MAG: hypothetical protein LBG52_07740 [Candidatus Peribacteria bacterium]|jgi:hypothetical protein|nr:hypothetical protein [Candidatus Peribacteria bacterium]